MDTHEFVHPELRAGEVFFRNCTRAQFDTLGISSKRMGVTAYDGRGNALVSDPDWHPVFFSAAEIATRKISIRHMLDRFSDQ